MELRQLEHFLAVADEKHFTRAAQRMNIVQSGLSASIRALEHELKAELFLRTTRRVELTIAGQVLYDRAQRVVAASREARNAVAAVQGLGQGKLLIGTAQSLGAFIDLPLLLHAFHTRHPEIEIHLCQGGSALLLEKIREGQLDLAFVPIFGPTPGIVTTMIACGELVLACPPGHPLAGASNIALAELKAEPFIDFQPSWGTRRIVDHAFTVARIDRRIAFEVTDLGTLFDLVARGLGIALVPEPLALARSRHDQPLPIAIAELRRPEICWELVLAFAAPDSGDRRPGNPAARVFIDVLNKTRGLPAAYTQTDAA
jgi:DNA-binding transcriptional LysR family regulator